MSRRVRLEVAMFVCLVTALLLVFALTRRREPSWNGRLLSDWLVLDANLDSAWVVAVGVGPRPLDANEEQVQAVRQIGTNALPCLLSWIPYEPPSLRAQWRDLCISARKHPLGSWLFGPSSKTWPPDPPILADCGFRILGEQASPAIPLLARQANAPATKENAARLATQALGHIGPRALPELISILTNRSPGIRRQAVWTLGRFGTNATPAVPALIHCFKDADEGVAMAAMAAIPEPCLHQDDVFTALANSLHDPRGRPREIALSQLYRAGSRGVPVLEQALRDSDPDVRFLAFQMLLMGNHLDLTNAGMFEALTNTLHCSSRLNRSKALNYLVTYGTSVPEQAIGAFRSLLQDPDGIIRAAATSLLQSWTCARWDQSGK